MRLYVSALYQMFLQFIAWSQVLLTHKLWSEVTCVTLELCGVKIWKKLPALPAGSMLAHYGVKSSCRGQQKHDRRRRREARLAGVTFSLPRRASLRWEGVQQLWAIARCWQQHCTILRDKHCYNCNILLLGVMYDSIIKVSPFHFLNIWVIGQKRWRFLLLDYSVG